MQKPNNTEVANGKQGQEGWEPEHQKSVRGIITPRDRELVALIAMARYLSTAQANQLLRPGRSESVGRRRLYALAGITGRARSGASGSGRAVFDPPYLRRLRFRASSGERFDLWALTPQGYALALQVLGTERKLNREDVGEAFLEHSMVLTDLFVALAAPLLAAGCPVSRLPFRWDPTDSKHLPWEQYDASADKVRARRIVPDAVLELAAPPRRFFIECEMGSHSIVAASDEKAGATLAKTERYDEFFAGGFYRQAYPDGWPAEVLYLVRSEGRMGSVNAALARWRQGRTGRAVNARALTHARAEAELRPLLPASVPPSPPPPGRELTVTRTEVESLKRFFQESLIRLESARKQLRHSTEPDFVTLATQVRAVIARLSGAPQPSSPSVVSL